MPSPNDMAYVMMVIYEFEGRLCSNAVLYVCRYVHRSCSWASSQDTVTDSGNQSFQG
jgi:hypothetical protein